MINPTYRPTIRTTLVLTGLLLLGACANRTSTSGATPSIGTQQEMADRFANAVEQCVGKGYQVGSLAYEACVKSKIK
jgi:hypothetical protein